MPTRPPRVFVSSTSEDLRLHRRAVLDAVNAEGFAPVMMEHFGAVPDATVRACVDRVRSCDLVVAVVAFRRGWVPPAEQGGDGVRSVTALELEAAWEAGIPVYVLLADRSWPGDLYEDHPDARAWVKEFRARLNHPAAVFRPGAWRDGAAEPEPAPEFAPAVRHLLLDHRSQPAGVLAARRLVPLLQAAVRAAPEPPSVADLRAEYQRAAPPGWDLLPAARDPIAGVAEYALNLGRCLRRSDGSVPLLRFARALLPRVPAEFADPLATRLKAAAEELGETAAASAPRPPEPTDSAAYLLVKVRPAACGEPDRYMVQAWLFHGEAVEYLAAGEERPARAELPAVLDRLRALAEPHVPDLHQLPIEFLLPRELVADAVDQWPVTVRLMDDQVDTAPAGVHHPLVVRSNDRYARSEAVARLAARHARLAGTPDTPLQVIDAFPAPPAPPLSALRVAGANAGGLPLQYRLLQTDAVVCAVMDESPPPRSQSPADALNTLLLAGIPLIVWSRGGRAVADELARRLGEGPTTALAEWVRCFRQEAFCAAADHPGRHIGLLWDDPRRVPPPEPQHRLRPPS